LTTKILLDTDIGSDIDDAICLAYLLANPQCDLLGITTVTGESELRAQMASALCQVAGKEIPIFPGAEEPLLVSQKQPKAQQAAALDRWKHRKDFPKGQAVQFLRETIHSHPGEIVLLTIGPLTNIGLLFALDPEIPSLLKGLVMMCGMFAKSYSGWGPVEWNALVDPHAAAIVYRHAVRTHCSIGLDVTVPVRLSVQEFKEKFQSPLLQPVLDFAQVWFQKNDHVTFHDPLAAATIFDPEICQYKTGTVEIELADPNLLGKTRWTPDAAGGHQAALGVDPNRFFRHYFSMFQ